MNLTPLHIKPLYASRLCALGLIVLVVALDYVSKLVVLAYFEQQAQPLELTSFLRVVLVYNRGVSFGMFAAYDARIILIILQSVIALCVAVWCWRTVCKLSRYATALVVGGALGNVYDRIVYGAVVDFIDFHAMGYHYPAFNVADSSIFLGVCGLLIASFIQPKQPA